MATYLENLKTARNNIAANLAAITASPKPTYTIDGRTVDWNGLFTSYTNQLQVLDDKIAGAEPFEIETIAYTDEW